MLIELNAFCDISPSVFAVALLIRNYPHWKEEKNEAQKTTHQNTDTSFPNQESLTRHLYKPTHSEEMPH